MCKEKNSIVYLYRMTHDYGTNPCCFNEAFEPTPELLTLGGCGDTARKGVKKHKWLDKGFNVYVMAVTAKNSKDEVTDKEGKRHKIPNDKNGMKFIPEPREIGYQGLIYAAKISSAMTRDEYWQNPKYSDRKDAIWYREHKKEDPNPVLLSDNFVYFGKKPLEIEETGLLRYFLPRGKSFGDPNPKHADRLQARDELVKLAEEVINENKENPVVNYPYHPWGREVLWNLKGCN